MSSHRHETLSEDSATREVTAGGSKLPKAGALAQAGAAAPGAESVKLVVKSDEEHAKKGSDGACLPADFTVKAGATVKVTV